MVRDQIAARSKYEELVDACLELIYEANIQYSANQQNEDHIRKKLEQKFNELALRVFSYQFEYNDVFHMFCRQRGKTPRTVTSWRDIPALPLQAFKQFELSCTNPAEAAAVFMTSGTTNPTLRGKNVHPSLRLYDESMKTAFKWNVISPSNQQQQQNFIVLFPTETILPHSSLAHYLQLAATHFGGQNSQYVVNEHGLEMEKLLQLLNYAEEHNEPLLLLGATFSFVHAIDWLRQQGRSYKLPEGSMLMDTGGTKGRSREIEQEKLYKECEELLGIPRSNCINMYGMTELSTQFYDNGIVKRPGIKVGPPWIRTRAVNPLTGEDMPLGEPGILVHYDLANINSVMTILTEDMGYMTADGGFVLLGRAEGSAAKGCSMVMEEFSY